MRSLNYGRYALRRIINCVLTYIVIIFIYSALFNVSSNEMLETWIKQQVKAEIAYLSERTTANTETILRFKESRYTYLRKAYHVDEPVFNRIFWQAIRTLMFRFGRSSGVLPGRRVLAIIGERLPRTLILFSAAALFDFLFGVMLGLKKAQHPGSRTDRWTSLLAMFCSGMPIWWMGMVSIMAFSYAIPIFPSWGIHTIPPPTGWAYVLDFFHHLALPVIVLVAFGFLGRAFFVRNIVLGTLQEDYITSARARGLPEKTVLYGHTLRASAPPIVTMGLLSLLSSLMGSMLFECAFSWPGLGSLFHLAALTHDVPVLLGNLAITTGLYLLGLLFLDLTYGLLDPRINMAKAASRRPGD